MQRRNARHEKDPRLFSVNKFKRKQLNFGIVVRTSHLIRLTNKPKFSTHSAMTLTRAICSRVLLFYFSLFLLFIAQQKAFMCIFFGCHVAIMVTTSFNSHSAVCYVDGFGLIIFTLLKNCSNEIHWSWKLYKMMSKNHEFRIILHKIPAIQKLLFQPNSCI